MAATLLDRRRAAGTVAAALLLACCLSACGDDALTTAPGPPATPGPTPAATPTPPLGAPSWNGSWSFESADPAGDCFADYLNEVGSQLRFPMTLTLDRSGDLIGLWFAFPGFPRPSEGFWPQQFAGTVAADGAVSASVPAASIGGLREDPWMEICYPSWLSDGGTLSGRLSGDGRRLDGSIAERFRVRSGATVTVRSRFTAKAP